MAIDTAERRRAVGAFTGFAYGLAPGVTPNDFHDIEWRSQVAWSYPGVLSGFMVLPGQMNESLRAYLNDQYGTTQTDLTPLLDRYVDADTLADKNVSMRELKVNTNVENR